MIFFKGQNHLGVAGIHSLARFTHVSFDIHRQHFSPFSALPHSKTFLPFVGSIQGWDPGGLLPMQFAKLAPAILQLLLLKGVGLLCDTLHIYATYVYIRVLKMGNYQIMLTHR